MERLGQCVERSKREPSYLFVVVFLDLDNFKVINDSLGHRAGDELLNGIAQRLETCLRSLDSYARPTADTTARLGGNEFVILLDGIAEADDALRVADRVHEAVFMPFRIGRPRGRGDGQYGHRHWPERLRQSGGHFA